MRRLPIFLIIALLGGALITGCNTSGAKRRQLEQVAKDWCMTIRASQVLPVYPLTQDLQPGDVFLVRTRIEDEVAVYEKKGFLPLDQLFARILPTNYPAFYSAHTINNNTVTPYQTKIASQTNVLANIMNAPGVAFPAYSFSVKKGGGLNLAIPISGVPMALNLMGSASAQGSVTISEAYTYGVDINSLYRQVLDWASANRSTLAQFETTQAKADVDSLNYLRVVNRVFLTRKVDVSLHDDKAWGGSASGGANKTVNVANLSNNAAANFTNLLVSLNSTVTSNMLAGGTGKYAQAGSRGVALTEEFPTPLVLGYLGFDIPILANGNLGAPISTHARIHQMPIEQDVSRYASTDKELRMRITNWLDATANGTNTAILERWLKAQNPPDTTIPSFWVNSASATREKLEAAISGLSIP